MLSPQRYIVVSAVIAFPLRGALLHLLHETGRKNDDDDDDDDKMCTPIVIDPAMLTIFYYIYIYIINFITILLFSSLHADSAL